MINLITPTEFRTRLSLPEDDGIIASLESAIPGATAYIESVLGGLDAGTKTDLYMIEESSLTRQNVYRLITTYGFIEEVVVSGSDTIDGANATVLTPLSVNAEKGLIILNKGDPAWNLPWQNSNNYRNRGDVPVYLRVSYSYGFEDLDERIPQWLKEVAIAYTVQLMSMQQVADKKEVLSNVFKFVQDHGGAVLDTHQRIDSFAIKPMA